MLLCHFSVIKFVYVFFFFFFFLLPPGNLFLHPTDENTLIIKPTAFSIKDLDVILSNVAIDADIKAKIRQSGTVGLVMDAGRQIGKARTISGCDDFVRVTMKKRATLLSGAGPAEYVDPTEFIYKNLLDFPGLDPKVDFWHVKLLGKVLKQVRLGLGNLCIARKYLYCPLPPVTLSSLVFELLAVLLLSSDL